MYAHKVNKKLTKKLLTISVTLLTNIFFNNIATAANNSTESTDKAAVIVTEERQQQLLHLLKQDCGSCHGMTLKGGLGPALLPSDLANKPVEYLAFTILQGRPNTAMPPWNAFLSPTEAQWLAQQLLDGVSK